MPASPGAVFAFGSTDSELIVAPPVVPDVSDVSLGSTVGLSTDLADGGGGSRLSLRLSFLQPTAAAASVNAKRPERVKDICFLLTSSIAMRVPRIARRPHCRFELPSAKCSDVTSSSNAPV